MAVRRVKSDEVATPETTSARAARPKKQAPMAKVVAPRPAGPSPGIRRAAELLKQASDPTRLQIIRLLGDRERNVSELCTALGAQSQPAVSHHLALLRHGRLIEPRREGKHNYYGLTSGGLELAKVVATLMG